MTPGSPAVEHITARAHRVPTETPEADGTLEWDSTSGLLCLSAVDIALSDAAARSLDAAREPERD
ncbi:hypothetical protein AB0383_49400 [Amycolatopsis sp. NPDC051373]|uniref:hypothetical protein n=1 Tax=Amycolatopsis sp. NPDC051373 TaxID=3155801 RepID=UPI00344F199C